MKTQRIFALMLVMHSPWVMAANTIPWKTILLIVAIVSMVVAVFISIKNTKADSRAAKILLAGLYFWILTFAQLMALAFYYQFFM